MTSIKTPYLIFLGDAPLDMGAKTAEGVLFWRPDYCLGQWRMPEGRLDLGLPSFSFEDAVRNGAHTLLIGVTNAGGRLPDHWVPHLSRAVESGLDIASGLHDKLNDIVPLKETAQRHNRLLHDVRYPPMGRLPMGTGKKREGKRALMVGTDCAVGKKFTALALHREMQAQGRKATFRATGQTGILIAGEGVAIDAVPSDFIAGIAEALSPDNEADHWDIIEGQASVLHPAYGGVTLGLVHGSQPDAMILCHQPGRINVRGLPHRRVPSLKETIAAHEAAAHLTNLEAKVVGISLNTHHLDKDEAQKIISDTEQEMALPTTDPIRFGAEKLVVAIGN